MRIFFFGSHSTANVALRLIDIDDLASLSGKAWVDLDQTLGDIFMYSTLADAEIFRCLPHGGIVLDNIMSDLYRTLFNICFQKNTPALSVCTVYARVS